MISYYKMEQRDIHNGKKRTVYKVKNERTVTGDEFISSLAAHSGQSAATIKGVLTGIATELAEMLGQGYSVTLPDIGTFSVGIQLKAARRQKLQTELQAAEETGEEQKVSDPNSANLTLSHINFRKSPQLFKEVSANLNIHGFRRIYGKAGSKISIDKSTQEERLRKAHEYLETNGFMHIVDYARLNKLSRSSAQRELQDFANDPNSGITTKGRGSHRIYVLSAEN